MNSCFTIHVFLEIISNNLELRRMLWFLYKLFFELMITEESIYTIRIIILCSYIYCICENFLLNNNSLLIYLLHIWKFSAQFHWLFEVTIWESNIKILFDVISLTIDYCSCKCLGNWFTGVTKVTPVDFCGE